MIKIYATFAVPFQRSGNRALTCLPAGRAQVGSGIVLIYLLRALSSVGSEHLPYKQGVTGSNPVGPTLIIKQLRIILRGCFFYLHTICII